MKIRNLIFIAALGFINVFSTAVFTQSKDSKIFEDLKQKGFVAAKDSGIDAKTKLPTRIVHQASGIAFVLILPGEFMMGSPDTEAGRETDENQHRRVIKKPFYIGETEVTVGQFRQFVEAVKYQTDAERGTEENGHYKGAFAATGDGNREWTEAASWRNPFPNLKSYRADNNHPVVHVSWNDARRFVEHFGLSLPTEAQWEYAARAGSKTRFFWGEAGAKAEGFGNFADAAGKKQFPNWNMFFGFDDRIAILSVVRKYQPNNWKIYDVQGSVSEWTADAYRKDYPTDGADESALSGEWNSSRVIRGGSWLDAPDFNRSAKRIGFAPNGRRDFIGFRAAFNVQDGK